MSDIIRKPAMTDLHSAVSFGGGGGGGGGGDDHFTVVKAKKGPRLRPPVAKKGPRLGHVSQKSSSGYGETVGCDVAAAIAGDIVGTGVGVLTRNPRAALAAAAATISIVGKMCRDHYASDDDHG